MVTGMNEISAPATEEALLAPPSAKPHAMLNSRIETNARLENNTYEDGLVILSTLGAVES